MIKNIERTKDGLDSRIDRARDAVVGVADLAERGVAAVAERAVEGSQAASAYVREKADTVSRDAHVQVKDTATAIDRGYLRARSDLSRASATVTDYVAENPGRAMLLVAVAGFALGLLAQRRRSAA